MGIRFTDIIEKKKTGKELSQQEIQAWIDGYVSGEIPDYQVSALLMAILFKGMTAEETKELTMAMMHSGDVMNLSAVHGVKVDKHSTGGVGDKTSLVLGPMVAACGAVMAKMSGRGLGFTGGTIDKLEAIDGFKVTIPEEQFIKQVNNIGLSIVGQTANLVPADKKLYALRDVTGTVNAMPLIASSIMSKKLAAGADVILLDVKCGDGAFMKTPEEARVLAQLMIDIGTLAGRRVRAMITDMNSPLGCAIGNALEVREAIMTLQGNGPEDLTRLCIEAGAILLKEAGIAADESAGERMLAEVIDNGKAFEKFVEFVQAQGGHEEQLRHLEKLPQAAHETPVLCTQTGVIQEIKAMTLGNLAMQLGAGRATKEDEIWPEVGIVLTKKPGELVKPGDILGMAYHREALPEGWLQAYEDAYEIVKEVPEVMPLIYQVL